MRVVVVVEGQTERKFADNVLKPHFEALGIAFGASIVGKGVAQKRGHRERGGGHFVHWRKDLMKILEPKDPQLRATTLFDLYGLPEGFPGLNAAASRLDSTMRCDALQNALAIEIGDDRLIPYIQRHEFEALVLAHLDPLREILDSKDLLVLRSKSPEDFWAQRFADFLCRLRRRYAPRRRSLRSRRSLRDRSIAPQNF